MDSVQNPSPAIPQQISSAASPGPDSGKRKKLILMIAIAAVLLIALIAGIAYLLIGKNSAEEVPSESSDPLLASSYHPLAETPSSPAASPGSSPSPAGGGTPPPSPSPAAPVKSLLVILSYSSQPSFSVSINNVEYVSVPPTIDMIKTEKDNPHSVIQVKDRSGTVIYEEAFALTTRAWVEGMESDPFIEAVPEGTEDLVIPIPADARPDSIQVIAGDGQMLDSYDVKDLEEPSAGTVQGDQDGRFIIAVTSEGDAAGLLPEAYSETLSMVQSISPWSKYKDKVEVKSVPNTSSLGCKIVKGGTGAMYPFCPNQGRVANAVSAAIGQWDAIIVINNVYCGCGMVAFNGSSFSPVVAIGKPAYPQLIAHELGHAIGHMTDEYMHKHGGVSFAGPNCFYSQNECQQAIAPYQSNRDAQCSAGCNQLSTWRPASLMMYNNLRPGRYGPVERCEMEKKITKVLGLPADCEEDEGASSPQPSASGEPKDFYGWSR